MSIRLERTPLIVGVLFAVGAVAAAFLLPELTYTFILAGLAVLMLALAMFAGSRNRSDVKPITEDDLTPSVAFGPGSAEVADGAKLTGKEKRALKAADKAAAKAAKERAKFEKEAQAEADKAAKQAAKEQAKRDKAAAKAAKKGHATEEETEAWFAELRASGQQPTSNPAAPQPAATPPPPAASPSDGPFGPAVEAAAAAASATAEPLYDNTPVTPVETVDTPVETPAVPTVTARDNTEEIPIVKTDMPVTEPATVEVEVEDITAAAENADWQYAAYSDGTFTPPFSSNLVHVPAAKPVAPPVDSVEDDNDIADADILDENALPADVDPVYRDEEDGNTPAARLKSWANRLQSLASDIDHDWDSLMQAYEQRDALLAALEDAHSENERLRAELTDKAEVKEIGSLSNALETAKSEVARLYEDNRELARLKFINSQTTTRLRELRFALASQEGADTELIALIDQALAESE